MGLLGESFDDPRTAATLQLAAGLLSAPRLGQGLSAGLLGYTDAMQQAKKQKADEQLRALQMQHLQMQMEQSKRQVEQQKQMDALVPQFLKPGTKPDTMDNRDVGLPGEPQIPAKQFDMGGYANALFGVPGMQKDALALHQALQKDRKPMVLPDGGSVYIEGQGVVATNPKDQKANESPLAKLISEMGSLPPGDPRRAIYMDAIKKATTIPPGVSVSYGAPVPGVDSKGNSVFFQPGKDGGDPKIVQGVQPPPKETTAKDPTEFQAKAGLYFTSMTNATQKLDEIEQTNGWRVGMAETAAKNEDLKTLARSPQRQSYLQAQRQWIDSINRVRSGANLPEIEYDRAVRTFFPTFGEGDAMKAQKADMRKKEEEAMRAAAGRALAAAKPAERKVTRTGVKDGRKVVQYDDGTTAYAD